MVLLEGVVQIEGMVLLEEIRYIYDSNLRVFCCDMLRLYISNIK